MTEAREFRKLNDCNCDSKSIMLIWMKFPSFQKYNGKKYGIELVDCWQREIKNMFLTGTLNRN